MSIYYPVLPQITEEEIKTVRPFTLTSGYDKSNTRFVRVKDGYNVPAEPALVRKKDYEGNEFFQHHHVAYEGYLYRCHPGYVMATLKEGFNGWSTVVKCAEDIRSPKWITFNPFEGKKVTISKSDKGLEIEVFTMDGTPIYSERSIKDLGEWSILSKNCRVYGPVFKGLKGLLRRLRTKMRGTSFQYEVRNFSRDLRIMEYLGEITRFEKPLTFEEVMGEVGFCNLEGISRVWKYFSDVMILTDSGKLVQGRIGSDWSSDLSLMDISGKTYVTNLSVSDREWNEEVIVYEKWVEIDPNNLIWKE